jgi:hypothetical protein
MLYKSDGKRLIFREIAMKERSCSHVRFHAISLSGLVFGLAAITSFALPLPDNSVTATGISAFKITNNGTGKSGEFVLTDPTNSSPALAASSPGTGYGVYSLMTGTGRSGYFQINNANNTSYALSGISNGKGFSVYGVMSGTGRAGHFEVANASNNNPALSGTSNGSGYSLAGFMTGTGRAGFFQISNGSNSRAAIEATTNGTGSALKASAGTGLAGEFIGKVSVTGGVIVGGALGSSLNALELRATGERLFRLERPSPDATYGYSPNIIGGYSGNVVAPGIVGATIGGGGLSGYINQVNFHYGTVSGGAGSSANNYASTVGGGLSNVASGQYATIAGGTGNTASGNYSTVGGGQSNQASGSWSTIPGGYGNLASNINSFAAGQSAHAVHSGTFVWADSSAGVISSTNYNQVTMRAANGYQLFTNAEATAGVYVAPGGGSWLTLSDRNMKNHFQTLDPEQVLDKFSRLPITEWSYKAQDPSIRHMGPMAQDFYQAFGLGESNRYIGTVDADGVMMAAIQGLNAKLQEKDKQISTLEKKNAEMEARLSRLERLLEKNPAKKN